MPVSAYADTGQYSGVSTGYQVTINDVTYELTSLFLYSTHSSGNDDWRFTTYYGTSYVMFYDEDGHRELWEYTIIDDPQSYPDYDWDLIDASDLSDCVLFWFEPGVFSDSTSALDALNMESAFSGYTYPAPATYPGVYFPFHDDYSGYTYAYRLTENFGFSYPVEVASTGVTHQCLDAHVMHIAMVDSSFNADPDGDGVLDDVDNCPGVANQDQADADGDGVGDACEDIADADGDGFPDDVDNCPAISNPSQSDLDGDGIGTACDSSESSGGSGSDGIGYIAGEYNDEFALVQDRQLEVVQSIENLADSFQSGRQEADPSYWGFDETLGVIDDSVPELTKDDFDISALLDSLPVWTALNNSGVTLTDSTGVVSTTIPFFDSNIPLDFDLRPYGANFQLFGTSLYAISVFIALRLAVRRR